MTVLARPRQRHGAAHEDISFDRALLNTWRGEREDEYQVTYASMPGAQDDGNWHTYRFDWHTDSDVCQGYPDYASFDPKGLCCDTTATLRPTMLRGTTPRPTDTDEVGCLACHACGGSADCPATSYCRGNGVCQGFPDYSTFDPRGECCARP